MSIPWQVDFLFYFYLFNILEKNLSVVIICIVFPVLQKPVPVMQTKTAPPNFDLEASSFPPLPGSLVTMQGEASTEVRLSDVVRGIKVPTKVSCTTGYMVPTWS